MGRVLYSAVFLIILSVFSSYASAFEYNHAINLAGKQRMLTQKMSKEAMLVALGIDKEKNLESLKKTRDLFDKTLAGLRDGDADLGLSKTKKPKIRKQLKKIGKLWKDFDKAVSQIITTGEVSKEDVNVIADLNLPLLKQMNKGVKFYEASAAGSGVNQALAKAINLSGRQRMLTQKMSKEFFLVAYGHQADVNKESLKKTIELFSNTLDGLIDGNASLGLSAAPNAELKAQLTKVKGMWQEFRKNVETSADDASKQAVANSNLPLLKEMNKAVGMFAKL